MIRSFSKSFQGNSCRQSSQREQLEFLTQSIKDVPSDLGHHRALVYHPNEQGYKDLTTELEKRLGTLIPQPSNF